MRVLGPALLLCSLPGCALDFEQWYLARQGDAGSADTGRPDWRPDTGCDFDDHRGMDPWSMATTLFTPLNPRDDDPDLSDDGRFLVFECRWPSGQSLCLASRETPDESFGPQQLLLGGQELAAMLGTPDANLRLGTPTFYDGQLFFSVRDLDTGLTEMFVVGFEQGALTTAPTAADQFRLLLRDFTNPTFACGGSVVMVQRSNAELVELIFDGASFEPVEHPELTRDGFRQRSPVLSPDGLTLYFDQNKYPSTWLWTAERDAVGEPFHDVRLIEELDVPEASEMTPMSRTMDPGWSLFAEAGTTPGS